MTTTIECCLHLVDEECGPISKISVVNYNKICDCLKDWRCLDRKELKIATVLSEKSTDCTEHELLFSGELSCMSCSTCSPYLSQLGHHKRCYSLFTDRNRITAAKKRIDKQIAKGLVTTEEAGPSGSSEQNCKRPRHRARKSVSRSVEGETGAREQLDLFPVECCICRKAKYKREAASRKRNAVPLSQCLTYNAADALKAAAKARNDEEVLLKVTDVDLVAKEAHYHKCCYREYTRLLKQPSTKEAKDKGDKAFEMLCSEFIEGKIMEGGEIIRMDKLTAVYVQYQMNEDTNQESPPSYQNCLLKRRLQRKYPDLVFLKNRTRSLCELVLYDHVQNLNIVQEESFTEMKELSDSETDVGEGICGEPNLHLQESIRDLYRAAMFMRSLISMAPNNCGPWPPSAKFLDNEAVKKFIPAELHNFLAWVVGEIDDNQMEGYVPIPDSDVQYKIYSIAQNIVYLASEGKKDIPKHLALGVCKKVPERKVRPVRKKKGTFITGPDYVSAYRDSDCGSVSGEDNLTGAREAEYLWVDSDDGKKEEQNILPKRKRGRPRKSETLKQKTSETCFSGKHDNFVEVYMDVAQDPGRCSRESWSSGDSEMSSRVYSEVDNLKDDEDMHFVAQEWDLLDLDRVKKELDQPENLNVYIEVKREVEDEEMVQVMGGK